MNEQKQAVADQSDMQEATAEEMQPMPAGSGEAEEIAAPVAEEMLEAEGTQQATAPAEAVAAVEAENSLEAEANPEASDVSAAAKVAEADTVVAAAEELPVPLLQPDPVVEAEADADAEDLSHAENAVASAAEDESAGAEDDSKRVVRVLSVGQPVMGTVRRITDFGAFVDIGVGRDGLIHISELSARRVGKVSDVLVEGQEIQTWIKKLDRERNRISLTLIDPGTKTIRDLAKGDLVQGTVTRMMPYGAFVDIGIGRDALLHVREMGERYVAKPEDVVKIGEVIEARVIEVSRRRGRVDLSIKGLREEPEPEPTLEPVAEKSMSEQATPAPTAQTDETPDQFAEVEVLTPMELAFKRAMEAEGIELDASPRRQSKRSRRDQSRMIQEEIIARTLSTPRK